MVEVSNKSPQTPPRSPIKQYQRPDEAIDAPWSGISSFAIREEMMPRLTSTAFFFKGLLPFFLALAPKRARPNLRRLASLVAARASDLTARVSALATRSYHDSGNFRGGSALTRRGADSVMETGNVRTYRFGGTRSKASSLPSGHEAEVVAGSAGAVSPA